MFKVLIVNNDGDLIKGEAEIVVLMANPETFPAYKVYPALADLKAWEKTHDALMDRRERGVKYLQSRSLQTEWAVLKAR